MSVVDYEKLRNSLRRLELQYRNYESLEKHAQLTDLDREAIRESVIRRFETCYDTLWKHIRRHLIAVLGLPTDATPNSPKPVLRIAHENHLLSDMDAWLRYAQIRIDTSHGYGEEKIENALQHMAAFIGDATSVYETMTTTQWEK